MRQSTYYSWSITATLYDVVFRHHKALVQPIYACQVHHHADQEMNECLHLRLSLHINVHVHVVLFLVLHLAALHGTCAPLINVVMYTLTSLSLF